MTNGNQFTAARAWLAMSQKEFAAAIGVTQPTVAALEKDPAAVSRGTVELAIDYFQRRDLEISEAGLKVLNEPLRTIEGQSWYKKLLDDVLWSGATELLIEFADDRKSPPDVIAALKMLRAHGITFRIIAEAGNTHLAGRLEEYRLAPSSDFTSVVSLIYADRVAISKNNQQGCLIIKDTDAFSVHAARFNILWNVLPAPKNTTAGSDARF